MSKPHDRPTVGREAAPDDRPHGADEPSVLHDPQLDSWTLGRARLVAFKTERLLSSAQRELGAFGEGTLSADLAPDLLRASEHVGEALAVLAHLQEELRRRSPSGEEA